MKYTNLPTYQDFQKSAKIRVASIMKQLVVIMARHNELIQWEAQRDNEEFPQEIIDTNYVFELVRLLNAELLILGKDLTTDYLMSIFDRYNHDDLFNKGLYRFWLTDEDLFYVSLSSAAVSNYDFSIIWKYIIDKHGNS